MIWRIVRSAALGAVFGLVLVWLMEESPERVDWSLAAGMVALLVVGMGVRRWLSFQREKRSDDAPRKE